MSSPNPFAQQPQGFGQPQGYGQQPPGGFYPPPPQPRRGPSCLTVFLFLFGCAAGVAGLACCGGVAMLANPPEASAAASEPFTFDDVPVPKLPGPGQGKEVSPGVLQFEYSLGEQ